MKRIISIVTSLVLIFTMITPLGVNAANEQGGRYNEAIDFLTAIGIMESVDETIIANPITREDFAVYLANLMGFDTQKTTEQRYFKDLSMTSYGTYAVNSLVDSGVISLPDNREFRPDDAITLAECAKMLCVATGYKTYAEVTGGFPTGYINTAKRNGIIPEILNSEAVSLEEAAELLYQAGQLSMYETVSINSNGASEYTSDKGVTLLSVYHNIYFAEGTVTSICGNSLYKDITGYEDIYINEMKFASEENARNTEILGEYVKYFYKYDKKSEVKTVVYTISKANAETIKISIADFAEYKSGRITYFAGADGNTKVEKRVENPNIIYNGYPIGTGIAEMFSGLNKGYIYLKDSDRNGEYDTIIVNDYINFVVNYIDAGNEIIYNKLNSIDNVDFSEFENVILYDDAYNVLALTDIAASDILAVAKSKDGAVATAVRTNSIFNGTLDNEKTVGGNLVVTTGGNEYVVEKTYKDKFSEQTVIGGTYYYSVDFLGNICFVDVADGSSMEFGWVIASDIDDDGFSKSLSLKMLTKDGTCKIYDLAERVRIDGQTYKQADDMYTALSMAGGASVKEFLIRYTLNDNGLLKEIDTHYLNTPYENDKSSLTPVYEPNFGQYYLRASRLGLKAYVNSDTMTFGMPSSSVWGGGVDDDEYIVGTSLINDRMTTCNVYTTNVLNGYCSAVVYKYDYSQLNSNYLERPSFMVSNIMKAVNKDGEVVRKLCGYLAGSYNEYEVDNAVNLADIEAGDLVRLYFDMSGRVIPSYEGGSDVVVLYDYSLWQGGRPDGSTGVWKNIVDGGQCWLEIGTASYGGYHARMQLSFGFVNSKAGTMVKVGYANGKNFDEIFDTKSVKVTVYDKSKAPENRVYVGTIDDILDYESAGDNCSAVLIHTRDCDPKSLIVYR